MSDNFLLNQLKFIPFLFIQNFDLLIPALSFRFFEKDFRMNQKAAKFAIKGFPLLRSIAEATKPLPSDIFVLQGHPHLLLIFMPQIPSKSHLINLISLIIVVLLWLLASILTQDILLQYNKPSLLAFLSVASMQVYFAFLAFEDPLQNYLEAESAY